MSWQCPKCNREFAKPGQQHICAEFSLESHFENKPEEMQVIWEMLLAVLDEIGPYKVDPVKSTILLKVEKVFLAVKIQRSKVQLNFSLDYHPESSAIARVATHGKRFYCTLNIDHPDHFDRQIMDWIEEAYRLTAT